MWISTGNIYYERKAKVNRILWILNKQRILKAQGINKELGDITFTFTEVVILISCTNSETVELRRLIGSSE